MFSKKSSIGVILLLCFTLLLSACSSEPSKTNTASEGTQKPAAELKITPFNPGENGLFSVTSSLIEGPSEVLLVDAQFEKNNAEQLVKMIRETGKKLTTVYISHKDPDFYFGLSAIREAFPDVKIVATPATVEGIKATIKLKSEFWGPIMKENAPTALIVPDVLDGDKLTVDGQTVQVIGLDGSDPSHTVLWVPSKKTILGGVPIYENLHVWMADNQTPESRDHWREILDRILALKPERVIPGHYMNKSSEDVSNVTFTRDYIVEFEAAAKQAKNSAELIAAMQKAHPDLKNTSDLELSAQVIKGERSWP
ncbi:MBL fold metallo-hydrolase [Brevibacillus laterosporus]|uniref:MBL fold metallo-hydrolase n=1 Tax=Brevibacillus halotolerans TaxID=1507437 RepID=A0ABT4HYZ2_9BACL|nr:MULTISPECIES: MBL fold metallo-hydrolase [Brevibacillus]MCR8986298.1 MBL fold metallo-hydrolase [Brevibacillus laterosporus]MCZ0832032.1 MBL fold metallo-hydrolase [Brevibacillus halotolerans]GIO00413.1 MBL fold metallo-hydrolase [Brevibacillus halotolerans]